MVYGENASKGHFFEFNYGEKSSGVTSTGYMMLVAFLFKVLPASFVPLFIKIINIIFWYGLIVLVFVLARKLIRKEWVVWVTTFFTGILPGSAYNSTIGMENGIFGFFIILWIYLSLKWEWFLNLKKCCVYKELLLGLIGGLLCWLRPEGFIFILIPFMIKIYLILRTKSFNFPVLLNFFPFAFIFTLCGIFLFYFNFSQTGHILPVSGIARIIHGTRDSFRIFSIPFSLAFLSRLLYYFPVLIFSMAGGYLVLVHRRDSTIRPTELLLILCFTIFFILYSTVFGSHHLARYTIFIMPCLTIMGGMGIEWIWERWDKIFIKDKAAKFKMLVFCFSGLYLIGAFAFETLLRMKMASHYEMTNAMNAFHMRKSYSDILYKELGNPSKIPVSIGVQEVQIRYWLDNRFIVRSLCGRVDPLMLKYVSNGNFDHIGYIKEREIDYLLEFPNYNRDKKLWSLAELEKLKPGESIEREGLVFTRIDSRRKVVQINHITVH